MGFQIKCNNCGQIEELEDGFLKTENEIHVYDAGEYTVAIKCNECGNEIVSYDE